MAFPLLFLQRVALTPLQALFPPQGGRALALGLVVLGLSSGVLGLSACSPPSPMEGAPFEASAPLASRDFATWVNVPTPSQMKPLLATLPKALQQRPVVVLLAAKYCGECQTLKPVLAKVAQQHSKNPSGVPLLVLEVAPPYGEAHHRLPLPQAKALVELLNPAVTPTLLRFSATGQLEQVQVGQQPAAALHALFVSGPPVASAGQQGA